jgi:hypothetical protein
MAYLPDPADPSQPLNTEDASTAPAEFRALKAHILANLAKLTGAVFTGAVQATAFTGSGIGLTNLPWAAVINKPTSLAGYGITDAVVSANGAGATGTWAINISGLAANANVAESANIANIAPWSGITGKPTTRGGYGITDVPLIDGSGASGTWPINVAGNAATSSSSTSSSVALTAPWTGITGKPTTRNGYGITDVPKTDGTDAGGTWAISVTGSAATASAVGWSGITGKPTTLAGFGITDSVVATTEGTFTPGIAGLSLAGTCSYSVQGGRYFRIGNLVHFEIILAWTGHTGTGSSYIFGLPFTVNGASLSPDTAGFVSDGAGAYKSSYIVPIGSSTNANVTALTGTTLAPWPMAAAGTLSIHGTYRV